MSSATAGGSAPGIAGISACRSLVHLAFVVFDCAPNET